MAGPPWSTHELLKALAILLKIYDLSLYIWLLSAAWAALLHPSHHQSCPPLRFLPSRAGRGSYAEGTDWWWDGWSRQPGRS